MANMPKPAYVGKALTPTPTSQASEGPETSRRSGHGDPTLLRRNEPPIPTDRKLGSGKSGGNGKANNTK